MLVQITFILFFLTGFLIFLFSLGQLSLLLLYRKKNINRAKINELCSLPTVTIQLPVFNEINVIERLMEGVLNIRYPKNLLHIQVLDDSTDDTTIIIENTVTTFQKLGFRIDHIKRTDRTGFKAGALQMGLEASNSDFIAIFDADFVPSPDFLINTLAYFSSPSIGMVQTRWEYFNAKQNWLTRVQELALNGHFIIDQAARNNQNLFMNFNGTAGIWRTKCLEDAGGWHSNTLTEDLDISYRAQLKGWKFQYCSHLTNKAELPSTIRAVMNQQFRWVKGSVETSLKLIPQLVISRFPWSIKVSGTFHLLSNYVYLIVILYSLLSLPVLVFKNSTGDLNNLLKFSPILILVFLINLAYCYTAASVIPNRNKTFASNFLKLILLYLGMSLNNAKGVLEALFRYKTPFIRTPKYDSIREVSSKMNYESRLRYTKIIPELLAISYFVAAVTLSFQYNDFTFLPYYMLLISGYSLIVYVSLKEIK